MLSIVLLSAIIPRDIVLGVVASSVTKLNVTLCMLMQMLSVTFYHFYAEYHYDGRIYVDCRYADCRYA